MRIFLFYPPMTIWGDDPTTPGITAPLGLANIAAYLEREGYDVAICDTLAEGSKNLQRGKNFLRVGLSEEQIVKKLEYYKPDIVGVGTMFTAFSKDAHDLAKIIKKFNSKILVVFGGSHASVLPQLVLEDKNIDLVVIGEGEETFLEIVRKFKRKARIENILGTVARDKTGKMRVNKPRPYIKDINNLPFPARHLLPMDLYLEGSRKANEASYVMRHPFADVVSSRGCPNNCIYCAVPKLWGRTWRPFASERVVAEIELLVKRYGVREVHFLDDNVSVDKKRLQRICDGIMKKRLDIKWTCPNGITIWSLDKTLIKKMKKSGCYRLTFGIESGCPETQKFIRKHLNLKKAKKIMKIASDLGLWTFSTYIIGFPYESKEAMEQTFDYAITSYSDFVGFILLMPFPGTDVTKIMINEGFINEADFKKTKIAALFSGYKGLETKYFTPVELKHFQSQAHKRLLLSRLFWPILRPGALLKKISNYEDFEYTLKIMRNYLFMFTSTLKLGEFKTHRIRQAVDYGLKGIEAKSSRG